MKLTIAIAALLLLLTLNNTVLAQNTDDYLILSDIGPYKLDRPEKLLPGRGPIGGPEIFDHPGVVGEVDHFSLDHTDKTYKVMYIGGNGIPSPTVYVTKHAGSDSDQWLIHEVDMYFRNYYGLPGDSYVMRIISGNTIMAAGVGGWAYRWVSGTNVIQIEYHDGQMTKPEPLEIVTAYLAKHPSSIPSITSAELRTAANKTTWIKDEISRRLWLCDKWFMQIQLGKKQQRDVLKEIVNSMMIYLDYREKFFRGHLFVKIKASDDKMLLSKYLMQEDTTAIKSKLEEYKKWWGDNRNKSISF